MTEKKKKRKKGGGGGGGGKGKKKKKKKTLGCLYTLTLCVLHHVSARFSHNQSQTKKNGVGKRWHEATEKPFAVVTRHHSEQHARGILKSQSRLKCEQNVMPKTAHHKTILICVIDQKKMPNNHFITIYFFVHISMLAHVKGFLVVGSCCSHQVNKTNALFNLMIIDIKGNLVCKTHYNFIKHVHLFLSVDCDMTRAHL